MATKIITKKQKATNRHWKNFVDKAYLGSHNLETGEEMLLTITKFEGEEEVKTADGAKVKQVLYFKEDVPKMIMNITNGNTLSALYGTHPDGWIGKQILVYAASVKAFGKTQDALRIRDVKPQTNVDVGQYTSKLALSTNLVELGENWKALPRSAQLNKDVESFKNQLKLTLK